MQTRQAITEGSALKENRGSKYYSSLGAKSSKQMYKGYLRKSSSAHSSARIKDRKLNRFRSIKQQSEIETVERDNFLFAFAVVVCILEPANPPYKRPLS